MRRRIATVVAILCTGAIVTSSAHAAAFTPALNLSYRLAVKYWGQEPTACKTIDKQIVPEGSLSGEQAQATIPAPNAAPGSLSCVLYFTRWYAPLDRIEVTCSVMVHEVGHLLGLTHTDDSRSPMYSDGSHVIPRICRRAGGLVLRMDSIDTLAARRQKNCESAACWARLRALRARERSAHRRLWALAQ